MYIFASPMAPYTDTYSVGLPQNEGAILHTDSSPWLFCHIALTDGQWRTYRF